MEETTDTGRGRARKQTTFFEAAVTVTPKKVNTSEGSGIKLSENPHFCKELEKLKADGEVCKSLHSLMYNLAGKKTEIKKNLRQFSGFSEETKDDRKAKILDKKKLWTTSLLKSCLGMCGVVQGGDREVQVNRLVDYLAHPTLTKTPSLSASTGKRKTKTAPKKGKKAKTGPSVDVEDIDFGSDGDEGEGDDGVEDDDFAALGGEEGVEEGVEEEEEGEEEKAVEGEEEKAVEGVAEEAAEEEEEEKAVEGVAEEAAEEAEE